MNLDAIKKKVAKDKGIEYIPNKKTHKQVEKKDKLTDSIRKAVESRKKQ